MLGRIVELAQRLRLLSKRDHVKVDPSTRLLRHFAVTFLVPPDPRVYVQIASRGLINARFIFESTAGTVTVGERVYMGVGTQVITRTRVTIGNDVTMAWGISIYDHNSHSFDWRQRARVVEHFYETYGTAACFSTLDWSDVKAAPIVIQDRVWIGFDAVILKGVTVGEGAIVGARSVVTADVPPYSVVAGNPARVVRQISKA